MKDSEVYQWWKDVGSKAYFNFSEFIVCMEAEEMLKDQAEVDVQLIGSLTEDCGITGQSLKLTPTKRERSKFVFNDSPVVSRDSFSSFYRDFRMSYECMLEVRKLEAERDSAEEILNMVIDPRLMPHQHTDPQLRLYCLAERAREHFGVAQ